MAPTKNQKNKSSATSSDGKSDSPIKNPSSPPRKTGFDRTHSKTPRDIIELTYRNTGTNEYFVVIPTKGNGGTTPAFNAPMLRLLEDSTDEEKDAGNFCMAFEMRDPTNPDIPLVVTSNTGREYKADVFVNTTAGVTVDGNEATLSDYFLATQNFTKLANAKAKEARSDFKYGVPTYVNKGNKTPPTGSCLFDFLMTEDCVTVMKKVFVGVDTKVDFMGNKNRDEILQMVFGNAEKGFEVVSAIDENIYNEL